MKREILKDLLIRRDKEGNITNQKGTRCTLIQKGSKKWVEKEWVSGDWLFPADYEYNVEKSLYEQCGARGLQVPQLLDSDDKKKILHLEYIEGPKLKPPCENTHYLLPILAFFDQYKETLPKHALWPITGKNIRDYNFKEIQYGIPDESVHDRVDQIFSTFLDGAQLFTIPFDAILKNVIKSEQGLYFIDFEWTIAGPYEFTLARLACEFNIYDSDSILARAENLKLYHLFLLRFYMQGRWPDTLFPYLEQNIETPELRELFNLINTQKYVGESWYS